MIELVFVVMGPPMGAVRQSRRDVWAPSKAVLKYRAWRDEVRAAFVSARNRASRPPPVDVAPDEIHTIAYFPVPPSWSKKRQQEAVGKPHRSVPDWDNVGKVAPDSLFKQDGRIHFGSSRKLYDDGGGPRLEVRMIWDEAQLP